MPAMLHSGRHAAPAGPRAPDATRGLSLVGGALACVVLLMRLLAPSEVPPLPHGAPTPPGPVNTSRSGVTTFRGNLTRSYYGEGPVPADPVKRWVFPGDGSTLCMDSAEGLAGSDIKEWCGTGWTGQPNVVPGDTGMEIRIGAFDGAYYFLDAGSGRPTRTPLQTGDLAKGSATTDPDEYPLYYVGSRDGTFRIVAMDRPEPSVLYELPAHTSVPDPVWNDDWDGAALVVGDYLLEGGENSWFYVVRLNRRYDSSGLVQVDPQIVARIEGFDDELFAAIGDRDVSIESSVALRDGVVYFANSGGLVQGWDISDVLAGGDRVRQVLRFWTGDDTDASIVIDDEGFLYVASEYQRFDDRSRRLGQLMKLDPVHPDDPLVWSIGAAELGFDGAGGSWSTPALAGGVVYFATAAGRVLEVDRDTGRIVWELQVGRPTITSPVVVEGTLLLGDCTGHLYAWDVSDPTAAPHLKWSLDLGDCVESTPVVWHGWLYVGTREGFVYGIADRDTPPPAP
jgi:hypothetical protein